MNYKIIKVDEQYSVLETATGQFVYSNKSKDEAKKTMKNLNLGGGFDGWTPSFMLNSCKRK